MQSQLITVENKSKELSPKDYFNAVWGVNYQVMFHYGRSRWVDGGYAPHGHLVMLPEGVKPPAGAWNLILLDHSDQQGALGYHDDEAGTNIPYSEVFVMDSLADGATVSSVMSHEAIEMLVDPDVENPRKELRTDTNQYYIVEACDAVQGNDYDVGLPEGRTTGILVADFCLPAWWANDVIAVAYSYRRSVSAAWEISPKGYMSVSPKDSPNNWTQIYGAQMDRRPKWASRLPRIHGE